MNIKLSQTKLTFVLASWLVVFYNFSFFKKTFTIYTQNTFNNYLFLASLFLALILATNFILSTIRIKKFYKGIFTTLLFLSTLAAYVMDSFKVIIDETMLLNIIKTDAHEVLDLLTVKLLYYLLFLFIIPVLVLYKKIEIENLGRRTEILSRVKSIFISLVLLFAIVLLFSKNYAYFFREQKPLRYSVNPAYWIYSSVKISGSFVKNSHKRLLYIGQDSFIPKEDLNRELIILVVGETARRDRFSLNGYKRKTNPFLEKEKVYSFKNVTSCGTSTAISVPCLFSNYGRAKFNADEARTTENLLDVLTHTKSVNVLWRDNNSDSKGVASRVKFEDFKYPSLNTLCNPECRDEGMIAGLQEHINNVKEQDIVIILHQMGNHGPAYYKRYPAEFEVFKPTCKTNELSKCHDDQINNAYDNAILYTDYFLSKVIALLKANSTQFNTAMLYISDHGESLGENGVYLHSLPYFMAPKEQIEVPMIMWFDENFEPKINQLKLNEKLNNSYSHDNIFSTVLGLMEVQSSTYKPELDILKAAK